MAALWDDDGPLQPGEGRPPSIRLQRGPRRTGPRRTDPRRTDLAAKRINEVLASSSDRSAVLSPFVGTLSKREANRIFELLERYR